MRSPLRMLAFAAGTFLAADVARRVYRNSQLFEPSPDPVNSWDPAAYGIPPESVEEMWIPTKDGETLHAWYARAENPVASALFCHGNKGNLTVSADFIPHFLKCGMSVLFFDYRGFGKSTGRASYRGVISDALTAAKHHDQIRPKNVPNILYGFSLGGAVAAQVIQRHRFDGLILQSTFTSLGGITRVLYPTLPMHLLAGKLFDTLSVIRTLEMPLLVLHGTQDEVIPCAMAHEIFGACKHPLRRMHCVEGGLHKDLFQRASESMTREISRFLADLAATARAA